MHRKPFDPFQIQAMFFQVQESRYHQREAARLDKELRELRARLWAVEKLRGITGTLRADARSGK